jgi:hypothetical protein
MSDALARGHRIEIRHRDGVQRHGCLVQQSFTRSGGDPEPATAASGDTLRYPYAVAASSTPHSVPASPP